MAKKRTKPVVPDVEAEFSRLLRAARKEHGQLKEEATANHPNHKSAVTFAKTHKWQWAEPLLEASRVHWAGAHDKALQLLAMSELSIPDRWHGILHFLRGNALHAKGKHDEAINAYRKALDEPECDTPGYAWINLGTAFLAKGEHNGAIAAYYKALDDPKYDMPAKAWTNLAQTYASTGRRKLAKEAFKKALKNPDPKGGDHARARLGMQLLKSKIETDALSPDDRAMAGKTVPGAQSDEIEGGVIAAIQEAGDTQYEKYIAKPDSERDDTLSILRGWSSAVTLLGGFRTTLARWRLFPEVARPRHRD